MFQQDRITNLISAGDDGRIIFSCPQLQKKKGVENEGQGVELIKINSAKLNSNEFPELHGKNLIINANFNSNEINKAAKCKSFLYSDISKSSEHVSIALYSLDALVTNSNEVLIAYGGSLPMLRLTSM